MVTLLGEPEMRRNAQIKNMCSWGMALEMDCPAPPGAPLKIEFEDGTALGESVYCRESAGSYFIGVSLEQSLKSLANLAGVLEEIASKPQESIARTP